MREVEEKINSVFSDRPKSSLEREISIKDGNLENSENKINEIRNCTSESDDSRSIDRSNLLFDKKTLKVWT